ncbi:MAG TPA: peptide chain release factor 1 [Acidimicrobiales bacterium]|nr:peptide chain release factor 1 [Acidimicrobiales bacterium]
MDTARLQTWEDEQQKVLEQLADPEVVSDPARLRQVSRRHKELEALIEAGRRLRRAQDDVGVARQMLEEAPAADRELARLELERAEADLEAHEGELRELLLPKDPDDGRDVIVEIRGAEGGEEANLFARDLFEMYRRYAEQRAWRMEVLSSDPSERDGLNEVTFVLKGADAWQRMKHEGGTHRVQRVPVTESQGRVHTSAATVTVLPEADEVEVHIDPDRDLKVDVFRSTGPGGQSVNTTDSAVRITHLPTGIVVSMQDEKSQIQNRARALQVLRARLRKLEEDRQAAAQSELRRSQVGGGGRSEKVRTYNFKENRVTDHRVKLTLHKLDRVLAGELDEIVDALLLDERERQLHQAAGAAADGDGGQVAQRSGGAR